MRWPVRRDRDHGTITLHLHDYPGEYLLDIDLPHYKYDAWATVAMGRMKSQCSEEAQTYERAVEAILRPTLVDGGGPVKINVERLLSDLRMAYGNFIRAARNRGMEMLQPGMVLAGWDGNNAPPPAVPFVPLSESIPINHPFRAKMREAYEEYCRNRVTPFRNRLNKSTRQLVLVDVLRVLRNGWGCFNDTKDCLKAIIDAYCYTTTPRRLMRHLPFPSCVLPQPHIAQVLFAATKADHATKSYRANMKRLLNGLVDGACSKIAGHIRNVKYEWFTSIRSTEDSEGSFQGRRAETLNGKLKDPPYHESPPGWFPGVVPSDWPDPKADGTSNWSFQEKQFDFLQFQPVALPLRNGAAWPHLQFDKLIWTLLSDCFHCRKDDQREVSS